MPGSMTIHVNLKGKELSARALRAAELATEKAAFDIEAHAKTKAPVDTGFLKGAIAASGRGLNWRIDSPAHYSIFQEFGTRFMAARPYMVPAVEHVRPKYEAAIKAVIANL